MQPISGQGDITGGLLGVLEKVLLPDKRDVREVLSFFLLDSLGEGETQVAAGILQPW